ncbi:MAG: MFS transporter, partial [Nitrospinota bacterium]
MTSTVPLKKKSALILFCFFHIIHDGVAESLVLLYPFIASEFRLSFSQVGLMKLFYSGGMSFFQ